MTKSLVNNTRGLALRVSELGMLLYCRHLFSFIVWKDSWSSLSDSSSATDEDAVVIKTITSLAGGNYSTEGRDSNQSFRTGILFARSVIN